MIHIPTFLTATLPALQHIAIRLRRKKDGETHLPSQCPYKSPQSWILYHVIVSLRQIASRLVSRHKIVDNRLTRSWVDLDDLWNPPTAPKVFYNHLRLFQWMRRH